MTCDFIMLTNEYHSILEEEEKIFYMYGKSIHEYFSNVLFKCSLQLHTSKYY